MCLVDEYPPSVILAPLGRHEFGSHSAIAMCGLAGRHSDTIVQDKSCGHHPINGWPYTKKLFANQSMTCLIIDTKAGDVKIQSENKLPSLEFASVTIARYEFNRKRGYFKAFGLSHLRGAMAWFVSF